MGERCVNRDDRLAAVVCYACSAPLCDECFMDVFGLPFCKGPRCNRPTVPGRGDPPRSLKGGHGDATNRANPPRGRRSRGACGFGLLTLLGILLSSCAATRMHLVPLRSEAAEALNTEVAGQPVSITWVTPPSTAM